MAYATAAELADFLGLDSPPADADRLLDRASRDVDAALVTAVYDTDANGDPTDADILATLKEATLEQASWRRENGDSEGGAGQWGQVQVGSARLARRTDRTPPQQAGIGGLGADARKVLMLAGLLAYEPWTW